MLLLWVIAGAPIRLMSPEVARDKLKRGGIYWVKPIEEMARDLALLPGS